MLALEDLSDHDVLRTRLNAGGAHAGVVDVLADYVADVAFGTSFLALDEQEFRRRAAAAVNPELCAITEDLVLTEPFLGAGAQLPSAAASRRRCSACRDDDAWGRTPRLGPQAPLRHPRRRRWCTATCTPAACSCGAPRATRTSR